MYIPEYLKSLPSGDYERKSTDDKDHQVASLPQQRDSNLKLHAANGIPPALKIYQEAITAKKPGRAQFNQMLDDIEEGIVQVIFAWDLSRLSRNPIDSGRLSWLLQNGKLKAIITPHRLYLPEDNVLLLNIEFGQANQFLRDLSKNVKRGLQNKLTVGWRPGVAPEGYLNDSSLGKGNNRIIDDTKRFKLIRKMWDMLLTGNYSVPQILKIVNEDWKYKMRPHKKLGSRPMSRAGLYRIFTNSFYYGWYEYGGEWYEGKHSKMITQDEYDQAQAILGRKGKQRPKTRQFSFTGMVFCGECGCSITAEEKINRYGSRYVYYHCTKKKDKKCTQGSIEITELEKQIKILLANVKIPEAFKDWAIKYLNEAHDREAQEQSLINSGIDTSYQDCIEKINNLIKLKISPMNTDGIVLSDEDYQKQMMDLKKEKKDLEQQMKTLGERVDRWEELSSKTFQFARYALYNFNDNSSYLEKKEILQTIGSNFTLQDKMLHLHVPKPLIVIEKAKSEADKILSELELDEYAVLTPQLASIFSQNLTLRRGWDSNPR